jgi:hypothetical protein
VRTLLSSLARNTIWYGFLAAFAVLALALVVSSGAGVVFGAMLLALVVVMHLAWLGANELRQHRELLEASLAVQVATRDLLEWMGTAPPATPEPAHAQPASAKAAHG